MWLQETRGIKAIFFTKQMHAKRKNRGNNKQ